MEKDSIRTACDIVMANATGRGFSTDQLIDQVTRLAGSIDNLIANPLPVEQSSPALLDLEPTPLDWKSSIRKSSITCLECGHVCKVLAPHLRKRHAMSPKEYRAKYGIPRSVSLLSRDSRALRQKMAKDRNLGSVLQKAREARANKV